MFYSIFIAFCIEILHHVVVFHPYRTLNRRYHSARDLTRLLRTRRQHEQDLKAGKVPAAPETVSETLWTVTSAEGSMAGVSGAATSRTFSGKPARTGDGTADLDSISEGKEYKSQIVSN